MKNPFDPLLDKLAELSREVESRPSFDWGKVTGINPLRVTVDGTDVPLYAANATGGSLATNRRVFIVVDRGAVTVIGMAP